MSESNLPRQFQDRRLRFIAIVALAGSLIACALVFRTFGAARVCGTGLIIVGGIFLLLAEQKGWPFAVVGIGLLLFFGEGLLSLFGGG